MDAFKLRSKEIEEDKVVLVFCDYWPNSNSTRSEGEILEAMQRETAKRVLKVMRLHPIAETSIAAHDDSVDWDQVEQEVDARELSRQEFPHEPGHELYDKIDKLTKTPTEESFEAAEAEVKKKVDSVSVLTRIKHRISHIFLPLQFDLQGLTTAKGNEKEKYTKEIIKEYSEKSGKNIFQEKLSDLQFLIANQSNGINGVSRSLCEDVLPKGASSNERLSLKDVVEQKGCDALDKLLRSDEAERDLHSKCAFKPDWQPDPKSGIAQFLEALDDAVQNNNAGDFLESVNDGVGDDGFNGKDFSDWFDELEGLLGDLRDELRKSESDF